MCIGQLVFEEINNKISEKYLYPNEISLSYLNENGDMGSKK